MDDRARFIVPRPASTHPNVEQNDGEARAPTRPEPGCRGGEMSQNERPNPAAELTHNAGCGCIDSASVGGASLDDPFVLLTGDLGDELEVGVVVEDRQPADLSGGGHESVDERERLMLTSG